MAVIEFPQHCPNCKLRYDDWYIDTPFGNFEEIISIEDLLSRSNINEMPVPHMTCDLPAGCGLYYLGQFVLYYDGSVLQSWEIIQPEFNPEKMHLATETAKKFRERQ